MTTKLIDVQLNNSANIYSFLPKKELNIRLRKDKLQGKIQSEHWFSDENAWFKNSFNHNNPLSCGNVNPELFLLWENRKKIAFFIKNKKLIFWGWGVGETEGLMVDFALTKSNLINIIAIDVNQEFLALCRHSLFLKSFENKKWKIKFKGIHNIFQSLNKSSIYTSNDNFKQNVHVMFGGTIGNNPEMPKYVNDVLNKGDLIVIGFPTANHSRTIFDKTRKSKLLPLVIMNYDVDKKLDWNIEQQNSGLKIFAKQKGIIRFERMLFHPNNLSKKLKSLFSWNLLYSVTDKHWCLQVYIKN